jgi:hypothetical protein
MVFEWLRSQTYPRCTCKRSVKCTSTGRGLRYWGLGVWIRPSRLHKNPKTPTNISVWFIWGWCFWTFDGNVTDLRLIILQYNRGKNSEMDSSVINTRGKNVFWTDIYIAYRNNIYCELYRTSKPGHGHHLNIPLNLFS